MPQHRRSEAPKVFQAFFDNAPHHVQVQFPVIMHCNVPESHHGLHFVPKAGIYDSRFADHGKSITRFLGYTQPFNPDQMHGRINGGFAGPLQVEDD